MPRTTKAPAKRKYVKKDKAIKESEAAFKQAIDEWEEANPKKELDEIEFLDAVVTGVSQMTNDQKSRFMNYVYSRYWMYITLSKLSQ